MIRPFAFLVPVYAAAVGAKNAAYEHGWAKTGQLSRPVVSVGNLSVGGSGKTPLVIRLAQLLAGENISVDVLSRGYGRSGSDVERVDAKGDAARFGDEPLLIARATKVPVYVGASRFQSGLLAERECAGSGIHLLDDGFQHRQLARALDIVAFHASDFEEGLLPVGRLREHVASLKRAQVIVLRAEDRQLEGKLRKRGIVAPIWIQHRRLVVENVPRTVAFCGIARPEEFFAALHAQSIEMAATVGFRDHRNYSEREIDRLIKLLQDQKAQSFVTTEKDAVRLTSEQQRRLEAVASLRVARLEVSLEDEAEALRRLKALL